MTVRELKKAYGEDISKWCIKNILGMINLNISHGRNLIYSKLKSQTLQGHLCTAIKKILLLRYSWEYWDQYYLAHYDLN